MATLTGQKIADTYKDLLQMDNSNGGLTATLRNVKDGNGVASPLQLSNSAVNLTGTIQLNGSTLTATASVLNAVADLTGANGIVAVSSGQVYGRTLTGGNGITITNAKGTEGNPTFTVAASIATSADLENYLPLTGGTLTGNLNGTNITVTGNVCATAYYGDGSHLTGIAVSIPSSVATSSQLAAVSAALAASIANHLPLAGGTLTGQLVGTSATFSGAVCATTYYGDGSNLTNLPTAPVSVSAFTINTLTLVSSASFGGKVSGTSAEFSSTVCATSFYGDGSNLTGITASIPSSVATSADLDILRTSIANVSSTMATSIANHLPLVGGTLTGQLIGTSATFSGAVCATTYYGDGSNLTGISGGGGPTRGVYVFTAVGGETSISGNDDDGDLLSYTNTSITDVYLNGILLDPDKDYTAATGSSIDALVTLNANDVVEIIAYNPFNITETSVTNWTANNLTVVSSANFTCNVTATAYWGDGSNLTNISIPASVATSAQLASVSARITSVSDFAVALSATMATSINNSNINITVIANAVTSINTVVANVSALTSVNLEHITSINTYIGTVSSALATSIANVSSTMATSINNSNITIAAVSALTSVNLEHITSINTYIGTVSSALATSIANVSSTMATSIANHLRLSGGTLTGQVSGTGLTMSGIVSANEVDAPTGSFSTKVSATAIVISGITSAATAVFSGQVNGTGITMSGIVSANELDAPTGSFSTKVSTAAIVITGITSAESAVFGSTVSVSANLFDGLGNVRTVPANSQTAKYTASIGDNGRFISITTGGVVIPSGIFSAGQNFTIYNDSTSAQDVSSAVGVTTYLVGTATTGLRTVAQRGLATVFCVGSNTFVITGGGLT
jgi:hypothetical protein